MYTCTSRCSPRSSRDQIQNLVRPDCASNQTCLRPPANSRKAKLHVHASVKVPPQKSIPASQHPQSAHEPTVTPALAPLEPTTISTISALLADGHRHQPKAETRLGQLPRYDSQRYPAFAGPLQCFFCLPFPGSSPPGTSRYLFPASPAAAHRKHSHVLHLSESGSSLNIEPQSPSPRPR